MTPMLHPTQHAPPADQPTKVFLALMPPKATAEQFHAEGAELCRRSGAIGSQRPPFILHMTLALIGGGMGRLPADLLARIDTALRMVRFPAFEVVLDEALSFDTRKDAVPFVLEGAALTDAKALRLALLDVLKAHDFNVRAPSVFRPHLTLAYARHRSPRMAVTPFRWTAREVFLIESWVGATKYQKLASWPLWEGTPPTGWRPH